MNLLYRVLKKATSFFKPKDEVFSNNSSVDETTILPKGLCLRFDIPAENRKYLTIGKFGIIVANFIFESKAGLIEIGNNVHIGQANFICREKIILGNDITMAWGITIYDHNSHSLLWEHRKKDNIQSYKDYKTTGHNSVLNKEWQYVISKPICIEDKVWIGFDVTILKGVTIGEGAVIAAKSVVTKNVEPWTLVGGNPAKFIKKIPKS